MTRNNRFRLAGFFPLAVIGLLLFPAMQTMADPGATPFGPGEKLTFQIKWSFIPAGEAVLIVHPTEDIKGLSARHFSIAIHTYPIIDVLYKVRDRIDSYTDLAMTHSLLYKKKKDGKNKRDITVSFDWRKNEAQYTNFGNAEQPIPLQPGALDPLAGFYFSRMHELQPGMVITRPVTDGKREVTGWILVRGREEVTINGTTYDTYLLEPELKNVSGIFEKSENARLLIWMTADDRRLPVKVKSKVVVGSFVAELIAAE